MLVNDVFEWKHKKLMQIQFSLVRTYELT